MATTTYKNWPVDVYHVTEIEQMGVVSRMALIRFMDDDPEDPPFYVPASEVAGI